MRVIVNAMCTLNVRSGVGHHTSELVQALQNRAEPGTVGTYPTGAFLPVNRFWVRAVEKYHRCLERPGRVARAEALARRAALGVLRRGGKLLVRDPFNYCVRRGGYDLYHEPNFHALPCDLPTVVTVHDLSALLHPQWHPPRRLAEYARLFADTLKRACHVLAVSEFTKREVVQHLGWPADRVTVTYNGRRPFLRPLSADECALVLRGLKLEPGYLLHVGTVEPRKNLGLLLRRTPAYPKRCVRSTRWCWSAGPGGTRPTWRPNSPTAPRTAPSAASATARTNRWGRCTRPPAHWCSPPCTRGSGCRPSR